MTAARCLNGFSSDIQQVYFDVLMFLIIGLSRFLTQRNALSFLYDTVICNLLLFVQIKNSWFLIPDSWYGAATICHQVRWLRWGHPSLFHTATSHLIWYTMFCVRDISYRLICLEFINMFSVCAKSGTYSRFNWWIIVVLTCNPAVLMCVGITDAPKL